jgi:hypothetical protein
MTKSEVAALRRKIAALAQRPNTGVLELAEALAKARALSAPPEGDRPSIADLMQLTDLSRRAIGYLIKVWQRFGTLDIPRDRLAKVGWTKLAVIAETCEPGDELDALARAESSTVKDLPRHLKSGRKPGKRRTVLLRFTEDDHEIFEAILLAHGARRPKRGRGLANKEKAVLRAMGRLWP